MYYRISKNEKNLFFGKKIAQVWAVTLRQDKRFCTVTKAKVSLCKCADSPDPSVLAQNGIQSPFESSHENFKLLRGLRLDQTNVAKAIAVRMNDTQK